MLHGTDRRIVPQRDLYLEAVERRRRRLGRERAESVHVLRGIVLALLLGLTLWALVLAL